MDEKKNSWIREEIEYLPSKQRIDDIKVVQTYLYLMNEHG